MDFAVTRQEIYQGRNNYRVYTQNRHRAHKCVESSKPFFKICRLQMLRSCLQKVCQRKPLPYTLQNLNTPVKILHA